MGDDGLHYRLLCTGCGERFDDDGVRLDCDGTHGPALLRTEYRDKAFAPDDRCEGIYRYRRWLPIAHTLPDAGAPIVYRSRDLGAALGLDELWMAFNGYWPRRGARLMTGTFKELEAYAVLGRYRPGAFPVVASAGNTAAAFALLCSRLELPCVVVVPERGLRELALPVPVGPSVRVVAVENGDYTDAIALGERIARLPGFSAEGGCRNVGRRDGLASVVYAAYEAMGGLADFYVQAIGSGSGAIAAHEAGLRLLQQAHGPVPRLLVCQNRPFTPIFDAWRSGSRTLLTMDRAVASRAIAEVAASVLTNRNPPYSTAGGLYDALRDSGGEVMVADNGSVTAATSLFLALEGVDIEPAAGVALACLRAAVDSGRIPRHARVLLNITGGGRRELARRYPAVPVTPSLRVDVADIHTERVLDRVQELCVRVPLG